MTEHRRLYRSRSALVGGVCAGVAERFDVDPVVVRILWLALTVLTFGLAGFPYLALWAALPKKPMQVKPVEVEPDSVNSDTFGAVDCARARGRSASRLHCMQAVSYTSAAHLPPVPPSIAAGRPAAADALRAGSPDDRAARRPGAEGPSVPEGPSQAQIVGALVGGCLLVSAGAALVVSGFIRGVAWWQCWPLSLVVFGIVRMAVPGKPGRWALAFSLGVCLLAVGLVLLAASMGFVSWTTLPKMLAGLWPLLLGAAVLLTLGVRLRSSAAIIAAAVLVMMFCLVGLQLLADPGPLRELAFVTPLGRYHCIPLPIR